LTNKEHFRFFTNLDFYLKLAYRKTNLILYPLKPMARLRCKLDLYFFPIEKMAYQYLYARKKSRKALANFTKS
jgi:hypothetical protein